MIPRSAKSVKNLRMVKALDAAAREKVVMERDGDTCIRCGKRNGEWDEEINQPTVIQWCHVHTREYHVTRWEPDNSFAGCKRCHAWFDNHKVLSYEWFRKNYPERWANVQAVLNSGAKVRVPELYAELKSSSLPAIEGKET